MILISLAIIVFIISVVIKSNPNPNISRFSGKIAITAGIIFTLGVLSNLFVIVEPGQVGVKTLFGTVDKTVLNNGLNIVNPLAKITYFDVRTQNYTMSAIHSEGQKEGDDAIRVLTKDGLEVMIDLSVLYRVKSEKAPMILSTIGEDYEAKIVRPITRTRIRDNAVYFDAISLYSSQREEFQSRIYKSIESDFDKRGLYLEQLLVRNIVLPPAVKATIETKINAEQESQKMQFVLAKEKQEAERKRVEAQGIADYQRIINTGLSEQQLKYEMIKAYKELATSQNAKVIVLGDGKAPIIIGDK